MRVTLLGRNLGAYVQGTDFKCIGSGVTTYCYGTNNQRTAVLKALQERLKSLAKSYGLTDKLPSNVTINSFLVDGKPGRDSVFVAKFVAYKRMQDGARGPATVAAAAIDGTGKGTLTAPQLASMAETLLDELNELIYPEDSGYETEITPAEAEAATKAYYDSLKKPKPTTTTKPSTTSKPPTITISPIIPGTTSNQPLYIGLGVAGGLALIAMAYTLLKKNRAPAPAMAGCGFSLGGTSIMDLYTNAMRDPAAFTDHDLGVLAKRLDIAAASPSTSGMHKRADTIRDIIRRRRERNARKPSFFERHFADAY